MFLSVSSSIGINVDKHAYLTFSFMVVSTTKIANGQM